MAYGKKTGGRKPGTPNKITASLKEMILSALDGVGGEEYLKEQATKNPTAFMSLIGKVLPMDITHGGDVGITVNIKRFSDAAGNRPSGK
jgi:hypothetical protein